jgi:hypothetical protein
LYWCSIIALKHSRREDRRVLLVSLARKKDGADIEVKSCMSFALAVAERLVTCGAMFLRIANNA